MPPVRTVLVSHFHWDREWYRTFEAYRGRLVDAVDRVLDLVAADPGFRFVLDGQAVLLEDYLAVRPERRAELEHGLRDGRLAAGPWYVQPDVVLPSGESLVRNLLIGRAATLRHGPVSRTGYVPDSFGHPAALPQVLAGFGITTFLYWRGNGAELERTGARYRWAAPDGTGVTAVLLSNGYFNAACLPEDLDLAARGLAEAVHRLRDADGDPVILMNGFDHMLPDAHTAAVAERLGHLLGSPVERVLLDEALAGLPQPVATFSGELLGGRVANLLPGVWSTRMPIKLANRRCEMLLEGWAEPWAALGLALGLPDERAALGAAWRTLLQNHAHDSLCGCSLDAVADQTMHRFASVEGLAEATIARVLERLAGLGPERRTPWTLDQEIVIFNPSPHARTDVVRVPLDPYPGMRIPLGLPEFPPLGLAASDPPGFAVDGRPVRVVASEDVARARWLPGQTPFDVELVARDVPAFGCRRYRLVPAKRVVDVADDGTSIEAGGVAVAAAQDGTFRVRLGERVFEGVCGLDDVGDRGDSYDCDPVDGPIRMEPPTLTRRRHVSGLAELVVRRVLAVPAGLTDDRARRRAECVPVVVTTTARIAPEVARVDLVVRVENAARDHRLRLVFPTGGPSPHYRAATTFGVATRSTTAHDATGWVHPAPSTFPHQGWIAVNGLMVVAPGLPEAEVGPDGTILVTLLRSVGWIARFDVRTRPIPAGPMMAIDGAQTLGTLMARLALVSGDDPVAARDAELGFRGVIGGPAPVLGAGTSLLAVEPPTLVITAVKPAEDGGGVVVRVMNPTGDAIPARLRWGVPVAVAMSVRLDEEGDGERVEHDGDVLRLVVPAFATRSLRLAVT